MFFWLVLNYVFFCVVFEGRLSYELNKIENHRTTIKLFKNNNNELKKSEKVFDFKIQDIMRFCC